MSTLIGALPTWVIWLIYLIQLGVFLLCFTKRNKDKFLKQIAFPGMVLATLTQIGIISIRNGLLPIGVQNIYDFIVIISYSTLALLVAYHSTPVEQRKKLLIYSAIIVFGIGIIFGIIF